jgi:hypothetical protein
MKTHINDYLKELVGKEIEVVLQGRSIIGILQPVEGWFIRLKPTVKWLEDQIVHVYAISAIKVYTERSIRDNDDLDQCEDSGVR